MTANTPTTEGLLAGIRKWVEIESYTADLDGCARMVDQVEGEYQAAGFMTERIAAEDGSREHLICRTPGSQNAPGVLVMSHLDTVHPQGTLETFPFRVDGDIAFGPGIYDMKGGAHVAARAVQTADARLPVTHLFTTDEETGSDTSRDLIIALARAAKYVLVTEPAREGGRIVTARKGVARYTIRATGQAAHAGARHADGRNAIVELAHHAIRIAAMTDYDRGITLNVGEIGGGTGVNVVPATAWMRVDNRAPTLEAAEEVKAALHALTPVDPDVRLDVTDGLDRPPYERLPGIASLFDHARTVAAEIGWELGEIATGGGSDGNFTAAITPTLDGLGVDGKGGHTDYEQLYIHSLMPRYRLMRRLLETLD